ncbi:MAG: hypothetical protein ACI4R9_06585 [Kiritimatiellia bacterium]
MDRNRKSVLLAAGVLAGFSLFADLTWTGGDGGMWSDPSSWNNGDAFQSGDSVVFSPNYGPGPFTALVDNRITATKITAETNATIARATDVPPVAYRYFRFKVETVKGSEELMQLSELKLYSGETDITQARSAFYYDENRYEALRDYDGKPYPSAESPEKLVDGDVGTKWLDSRTMSSDATTKDASWVVLEYADAQPVTKYEWYTANDSAGRDPGAWRLQGSNDNVTWQDLDVVSGYTCTDTREVLAYSKEIDYAPLSVSEICVADGATLTLTIEPITSFAKTGPGTLQSTAGLASGISFQAGTLSLGGGSLSVTKSILTKDALQTFLDGTYAMDNNNWDVSNNTPTEWVIGAGATFSGAKRITLSPESADRSSHLLIRDGGRLVTSGANNYIQNHDYGKTIVEITGAGSIWDCNNEIFMIPSNDSQCQNPRGELRVTDGATLKMGSRLSWGQKDTKFAVAPEGYMLVSNATVTINDCLDFGIKSDQNTEEYLDEASRLQGGWYKADFLDGAQITAQRIFVGREREHVELNFDGATFSSRANSSDFLMQDRRLDTPFVVTGRGLTVNTLHNTVLKGRFRGTGDFVKTGKDKMDIYDDQFFTGTLVCNEGTLNNTADRRLTFAASRLTMNGGTVNFSTVDFTNETLSVALNGGTLHLFNNGTVETKTLSALTLGAGVVLRFDISAEGPDQFLLAEGGAITNNATAENPAVLMPTILSALPVNTPYTLVSGGFTADDRDRLTCSEEGYVLDVTDEGALTITHLSETRTFTGGSENVNWSDAVWNEGENFISGDNATFATDGDMVHLDVAVTVGRLTATENAAITYTAEDNTPKYSRFRFHVDATKSNNSMMQLSEIELYNFAQKLTPDSIAYDTNSYGLDKPYPTNEKPDYAVDGSLDTKWLDYRGGNGRNDEQKAACYLEFIFDTPTYVTKYAWYTANDEQGRDPYSWRLLAYDEETAEWIVLDEKVEENVTEVRKVLAGIWEIDYHLPETPSLKISEAIDVADGKTLTVEAPISSDFTKTGAGTLVVTQPITTVMTLAGGGIDLSGQSMDFGAASLTADSTIGFYNGTFSYDSAAIDPGANMPRDWTIGAGALLTGGVSAYFSINTPEDDESYTLRLDGGMLQVGGSTSWLNSNSTGLFEFVLTNGATANFGGKVYAVASNERVLDKARIRMDVSSGSVFKTGASGHLTFGRENTQHAREMAVDFSVCDARLELGGNLDIGAANDNTDRRAGYYHLYFGPNSVLETTRFVVFDDRDDTSVVFDGATLVATGDQEKFIARDDATRGTAPFSIAAGGLTVSNDYAVAICDALSGEGGLTKTGSGVLTLEADQSFQGVLTVAGPVNLNGHTLQGGVALAPGGSLKVDFTGDFTGFPLEVKSLTADADAPFAVEVNYSSPLDPNRSYRLFTGVTAEDCAKISVTGLDLVFLNGSIYGAVNPQTRIWSGAAGDTYMRTAANWEGGEAPRDYDSVVFPTTDGGVVTNDNAASPRILFVNMRFPVGAGDFTFDGNALCLWSVSNEAASVQTYLNAIAGNGPEFCADVAADGEVVFANGLAMSADRSLLKTGGGTLTLKGAGPGSKLDLAGGTLRLADLADAAKTNPFATGSGEISLAGTLDLGGAVQEVKLSTKSGETLAHGGMKLLNGTIKLTKTGDNHYFEPTGDIEIGAGGYLRIEAEDGPVLNLARGDANKRIRIVCRDGGKLYSHGKAENVYLASGGGVKEVEIELENAGIYHVDNVSTDFGRSGNTIRMYGDGGKIDLNRHKLFMVADGGAVARVDLTNAWIKAGYVYGGKDSLSSRPAVSDAEFNYTKGSMDFTGFVVRDIARFHARLEGVNFDVNEDNANFFNVDAYSGESDPFELAGDACTFTTDKKVGIKTKLVGTGGLTVGKGTLTLSVDQAYTGATTVKSGATLNAVGRTLSGPLVVESGSTLVRPDRPEGSKFVRIVRATAVTGVDYTVRDDAGDHYFLNNGWLCYGRPAGYTISIR